MRTIASLLAEVPEMKPFIIAVTAVMYLFVVVFPQRKSLIALAAAAVMVISGAVGIGPALTELVNWNILMIYIGSLVIADLFIYSRVPAYTADRIVDATPSLGLGIVLILVMTGIISAFVENVATVLVMAPIAFEISRRIKMDPSTFMIGLAVMANLQGTATLVGDPPSMIFASFAGYSFNDFFVYAGKLSIFFAVQAGAVVGALYFWRRFRKLEKVHVDLPVERIVSWFPTVLLVLMIGGLAAISFLHAGGLHIGAGLLCMILGAAGLVWYVLVRKEPLARGIGLVKKLDWDTILFLVGIFIVVGAVTNAGILDDLADILGRLMGNSVLAGFLRNVGVSVLVSGFVDNVPYIVAMLPVADRLSDSLGLAPELFMFGLLVGSCLGGNLTPFGASANVVAVGMVRKAGWRLSFTDWIRIGLPFTLLTTAASALFVYLVWR